MENLYDLAVEAKDRYKEAIDKIDFEKCIKSEHIDKDGKSVCSNLCDRRCKMFDCICINIARKEAKDATLNYFRS